MHSDEPMRARATSKPFSEIVDDIDLKRRSVLKAGMGTAALALFGIPAALKPASAMAVTLGFDSVPFPPYPADPALRPGSIGDTVRVPNGYSVQVLIAHGDPIKPGFAPWSGAATESAMHQANAYGAHTDGMHLFPFPQRGAVGGLSNTRGVLCSNSEYVDQGILFPDGTGTWTAAKVKKALTAHGVNVVEIAKGTNGWAPQLASPYNRRITGETPCSISGPAAGHALMKTPADPSGRTVLGTLNNCANGYTPWGTYLTCEENFNGYFGSASAFTPNALEAAVGLSAASGYRWYEHEPRFDLNAHKLDANSSDPARNRNNEPNRFGWVVEIDPFNPSRPPVKRTSLGRFKHESAVYSIASDGRLVIYSGDDQIFEYIYKWVSAQPYNPVNRTANLNLLDDGTLYVAKFDAGAVAGDHAGDGQWLELSMNVPALNSAFGGDLARMLIDTRTAADLVGATPMDRPEWIAVHPITKEVYCTLTNNSGRTETGASGVDEANPRAANRYGHIIRWREAGGDPAATTFNWDIFVLAGDPGFDGDAVGADEGNIDGDIFGSPDGIWFDNQARLWIKTDISSSALGVTAYINMPNNMMLAADPVTRQVKRFLTGPYGAEVTGITATPDNRTVFVGIQHPGEGAGDAGDPTRPEKISKWPNCQGYGPAGRPRSAVVVITRNDGGVIGA